MKVWNVLDVNFIKAVLLAIVVAYLNANVLDHLQKKIHVKQFQKIMLRQKMLNHSEL